MVLVLYHPSYPIIYVFSPYGGVGRLRGFCFQLCAEYFWVEAEVGEESELGEQGLKKGGTGEWDAGGSQGGRKDGAEGKRMERRGWGTRFGGYLCGYVESGEWVYFHDIDVSNLVRLAYSCREHCNSRPQKSVCFRHITCVKSEVRTPLGHVKNRANSLERSTLRITVVRSPLLPLPFVSAGACGLQLIVVHQWTALTSRNHS
jgi:hypothetical protein